MTTVGSDMEIHRLLDEAFAGIAVTPEVQDLKEEMRANLVVRVADLERSGLSGDEAARRAITELGDVRSVVDETAEVSGGSPPWARNRVRPRPGYVVRTVLLSTVAAAALAIIVIELFGVSVAPAASAIAVAVVAAVVGAIVADALRQETTTNYPIPLRRALGYGSATVLALAGLGCAGLALPDVRVAWLVAGGLMVVASIVGFTYLGATQTNRHKLWVFRMNASHEQAAADRFSTDPAAAARFGLYTVVIWLVALAGFVVLSFTVGWAWSWLALLGGVVAMMLTLARTLFAADTVDSTKTGTERVST